MPEHAGYEASEESDDPGAKRQYADGRYEYLGADDRFLHELAGI
ncbi:hypothetical protein M6D81_17615 [Paenibacillus sp. J5C_2022]|nr:hypothetical protein [Paenibacillus sp. J5C2022]MCU6710513.1 hypothetical protein [Paenibacillus sp. J5C2022]